MFIFVLQMWNPLASTEHQNLPATVKGVHGIKSLSMAKVVVQHSEEIWSNQWPNVLDHQADDLLLTFCHYLWDMGSL